MYEKKMAKRQKSVKKIFYIFENIVKLLRWDFDVTNFFGQRDFCNWISWPWEG